MKVQLARLAYARSGDKGADSNIGVVARSAQAYELLKRCLTTEVVKRHFTAICKGEVLRYELDNLRALNFILHDSLAGGGSRSLVTDAQGKTHALALLRIEIDVPEDFPLPEPPRGETRVSS